LVHANHHHTHSIKETPGTCCYCLQTRAFDSTASPHTHAVLKRCDTRRQAQVLCSTHTPAACLQTQAQVLRPTHTPAACLQTQTQLLRATHTAAACLQTQAQVLCSTHTPAACLQTQAQVLCPTHTPAACLQTQAQVLCPIAVNLSPHCGMHAGHAASQCSSSPARHVCTACTRHKQPTRHLSCVSCEAACPTPPLPRTTTTPPA
jgi:hypothetical protein